MKNPKFAIIPKRQTHFRRTKQKQEIDLIEEHEGRLSAFEIKWNKTAKAKIPKNFTDNNSVNKTGIINSAMAGYKIKKVPDNSPAPFMLTKLNIRYDGGGFLEKV